MRATTTKFFLTQMILLASTQLVYVRTANAETCINGKIRATYFEKIEEQNADFCYGEKKDLLFSAHCKKNESCLAIAEAKHKMPVSSQKFIGPQGSPGANLCAILGGQFEFIEIQIDNEWIPSNRCQFKDGSYVSGGQLVKMNREKQKESDANDVKKKPNRLYDEDSKD